MKGPGKYDDLATLVAHQAEALGVILVVIGGNKGSGFSVQAVGPIAHELPSLLRNLADSIECDQDHPDDDR